MKQSILLGALAIWLLATGCKGWSDQKNDGFETLLGQPPYQGITDSIHQQPKDATLLLRRAERLSQNNHHEIAYYDYKKAWSLQPSDSGALLYASNLFLTGRNQEAVELLKSCLQRFPQNPEFRRRLGEAYVQAGQRKEALALFDDILSKDSLNFEILYEKALICTQLKDSAQGIRLLEKCYTLQPTMQNGLALANLYAESRNSGTPALCDQLIARDSSQDFIDPLYLKGIYYSNIRDYPKALALFDECIRRDWKVVDPVIEKGIIFFDQKNYDEALKQFKTATYINYTNPDVYYWMGRCYEDIGKKEEALDNYSRALALDRHFDQAAAGIDRLKK